MATTATGATKEMAQSIIRNPGVAGIYIKIGSWIKIVDIERAPVSGQGAGRVITIHRRGKPALIYRGSLVDHVKAQLTRRGVPD